MRKVEDILKLVCSFLNKSKIEYVIVGGFAVIFHGNPRTTMDIDYVIKLAEKDTPGLVKLLKENGFHASEEEMRAALKEKSHCTVEDKETMFRLDIKGVYNEMDGRVLKNRMKVQLDDVAVYIASPEDTIANKLFFAREQDIRDSLGIYVRQHGHLNMEYLEAVCKKIGVHDALEDLRKRYERGVGKNREP